MFGFLIPLLFSEFFFFLSFPVPFFLFVDIKNASTNSIRQLIPFDIIQILIYFLWLFSSSLLSNCLISFIFQAFQRFLPFARKNRIFQLKCVCSCVTGGWFIIYVFMVSFIILVNFTSYIYVLLFLYYILFNFYIAFLKF